MTLSHNSPAFAPGTKSFALIVDDPDAPDPKAPKTTWVHWVLYDIPASVTALLKTATAKDLPAGTREGVNHWKRTGYGPCPPIGRHRYFHKLYALDAALGDLGRPTKAALERAMQGHILAKAELVWDLPAREVVALRRRGLSQPGQLEAQARHQPQDRSSTAQFRTSPSMMRRPNSQQPVMADSSVG